jgi:heterotetrameric sarcosine oxidase gamma subunit
MSPMTRPVRRSPLEAVHKALGGDWPRAYGAAVTERTALADGIGLAEPGLTDVWIVRGPRALVTCRTVGLDPRAGTVSTAAAGSAATWAIADDEVWLVADATEAADGADDPDEDSARGLAGVIGTNATVIDVSSGWTRLVLAGPRVRDLLEELVASDLSADVAADRAILQVPMANCRVILARTDLGTTPAFTLLVARDEAEHLWEVLVHLGEGYSLTPVGSDALTSLASAAPRGDATRAAVGAGAAS